MRRVLIPVDHSERTARAVRYFIEDAAQHEPVEVHLLNVQQPVTAWEVRRFLLPREIEAFQRARGQAALDAAARLLAQAGIPFRTHLEQGLVGETIARVAEREHCDSIFMGAAESRLGWGLLSPHAVIKKVLRRASVPVTLLRCPAHR
ncbi:MAG: universal stress protein [Pseudomonadota bacterium]|jgi:nucleotide-binding universal stress UspA family protein